MTNFSFRFVSLCLDHVHGAIVSRCHHEGDFTVSCDNKSKVSPLLASLSDSPVELMRYAKVVNGLYHNDTLCSYVPNTSCSRKQTLADCEDKPTCKVKNGWFNLSPDCDGNSYYTQLEYDCQPAFVMCDKETVINNVFSGMIYSPSYPHSFRKDDKSEPCYLTIHLPKNHHAEITLDHFDMLKTAKCIGDYVEIQQYKEVATTGSSSGSSSSVGSADGGGGGGGGDYLKRRNTGDISLTNQQHLDYVDVDVDDDEDGFKITFDANTTTTSTTTTTRYILSHVYYIAGPFFFSFLLLIFNYVKEK